MTKFYGAGILIIETIYRSIEEPDNYPIRLMDKVKVKGRQEPITIYEVFSDVPEKIQALKFSLKTDFEQAIVLYQLKEFEKAKHLFKKCLTRFPDDKRFQLYLERCELHMVEDVPNDWNGTLVLDKK